MVAYILTGERQEESSPHFERLYLPARFACLSERDGHHLDTQINMNDFKCRERLPRACASHLIGRTSFVEKTIDLFVSSDCLISWPSIKAFPHNPRLTRELWQVRTASKSRKEACAWMGWWPRGWVT